MFLLLSIKTRDCTEKSNTPLFRIVFQLSTILVQNYQPTRKWLSNPCRDPKFIQFMPRSFHSPFPENHEPFRAKVYSQFDDIHVTEVRNFKNGPLVISVRCTGPYSLQVTGRSTLDFTYQLSSVENLETGESKRLLGSPVKGNGIIFQPHNILSVTYCVKVMT